MSTILPGCSPGLGPVALPLVVLVDLAAIGRNSAKLIFNLREGARQRLKHILQLKLHQH